MAFDTQSRDYRIRFFGAEKAQNKDDFKRGKYACIKDIRK